MKPANLTLAFLILAVVAEVATTQETAGQMQNPPQRKAAETKSSNDDLDTFVAKYKARQLAVPACKDLESLAEEMEEHFRAEHPDPKNKLDPILAAIQGSGSGKEWTDIPSDAPDTTWDTLEECAEQTSSRTERAEALRVLAIWEKIRADNFRKRYIAAQPMHAQACENLDKLTTRVEEATRTFPTGTENELPDYDLVLSALVKCANDSNALNKGKAISPEQVKASGEIEKWQLWERERQIADWKAVYRSLTEQANTDNGPAISSEQNTALMKDCDQIVTVAGLTPNGLALYVPPEGQSFMAKNVKSYPRMCLVEDTNAASFAPSVPHYLLVWAYSENAFTGFQPVQQVTTGPISGSGTLTNIYGERWNFTFNGSLTEIDTVEAPYVLQSRCLYLWAYDANGKVISRHSIATSNHVGGDASYAAGYNASALISLLWSNPSHLIKSVLKDVQKASGH